MDDLQVERAQMRGRSRRRIAQLLRGGEAKVPEGVKEWEPVTYMAGYTDGYADALAYAVRLADQMDASDREVIVRCVGALLISA